MKETVRAFFAANRARIEEMVVEITGKLVAAPTVNAGASRLKEFPYLKVPGQERLAADVVIEYFRKWGIPVSVHEGAPMRTNVFANLFAGRPVLMMGCHLDVVPPGDGWDSKPFEMVRKGNLLYGRGVLDNKGPMAASMVAAWMLKESGVTLNGTFQVAGIASEEFREAGEMDPGLEYLLKEGILKPDMAVIPDIGENMKRIDIAEKGRAEYRIVTRGKQAHGSTPERGINAVDMMARVLTAVEALELPHTVHPVLGAPTKNLGIVRGGNAANNVPAECEAILDVRYVPGQTAEGVRDLLLATARGVVGPYCTEPGIGVEVALSTATVPHSIPADHALVKAVQASVQDAVGFTPEPFGIGGGTFAKAFNLAGIPSVGFGPGADDQFHVVNENIEVEELVQFSLVAALIACDLLA
jgi:acetylornithine deacetylase/succinyl-diaminopimelate desuccinylase family protein